MSNATDPAAASIPQLEELRAACYGPHRDVSCREIARRCGVDPSTVTRAIQRKRRSSLETILRYHAALQQIRKERQA